MNFRLAHLSDIHLPFSVSNPLLLLNKRLVGFLSWSLKRRHVHLTKVLNGLRADLQIIKPDHVVITGDIVNISLPAEYKKATNWLQELGDGQHVSIVPGNHDAYVAVNPNRGLRWWQDFMTEGKDLQTQPLIDFPYVRYRGPLAIIGLSTACPVSLFSAAGQLGTTQLNKLDHLLSTLNGRDYCRIILMHHPPFASDRHRRKQLMDIQPFIDIIRKHGAEMVLHGHLHVPSLRAIPGPNGGVPVIGVPSASASHYNHKSSSKYYIYTIAKNDIGWHISVETRELNTPPLVTYRTAGVFDLTIPLPPDKIRPMIA